MTELLIRNGHVSYGDTAVLHAIDLTVEAGEFMVIVGPSGCGKSTLLRAVAGLENFSAGSIAIGGVDVTHRPPSERGIAMVFQSYALYPHMTLYDNMAFALKLAKRPEAEIHDAVMKAAAILGIDHMLDRKPGALSGGQRQRVAIGRAIVRQPSVFLFDEPLSNLDAALRVRMRYEFADLHKQLKTTTIYVTHDQVEAMTLADRITVMRAGVIEQIGTPDALYARPRNRFVAGFIGSPQMNFLPATWQTEDLPAPQWGLSREGNLILRGPWRARGTITIGIRPEDWVLDTAKGDATNILPLSGEVQFVERLGGAAIAHVRIAQCEDNVTVHVRDAASLKAGERVNLGLPLHAVHLFDADGLRIEEQSIA